MTYNQLRRLALQEARLAYVEDVLLLHIDRLADVAYNLTRRNEVLALALENAASGEGGPGEPMSDLAQAYIDDAWEEADKGWPR